MSALPEETREARLLLAHAGATMRTAARVADRLGCESALLDANEDRLAGTGIGRGLLKSILKCRRDGSHRCHDAALRRLGGRTLVYGEQGFPSSLIAIPSPPAALYIKGRLPEDDRPVVAIIGSRRCTPEGERLAECIARDLARGGLAVVSGLARGVDSAALRGCLQAGGPVLGVLGSGLDHVYPPENVDLFRDTAEYGALISEFPLETGPRRELFPRRNRLISGLARGVLVVEASDKSGTLITVDHALEQDRIVMAVPGSVNRRHFKGTNRLIRDGANVILDADDVFASLGVPAPAPIRVRAEATGLSGTDAAVLEECSQYARTPDAIAFHAKLPVKNVLEALARLESRGIVRRHAGSRFIALRETWPGKKIPGPE